MGELDQLKEWLSYNPETGHFEWIVKRNSYAGKVKPGVIAGTVKPSRSGGYIMIHSGGKGYRAHRLAYWFMTGRTVPSGMEIDHINGNRADNRWSNLRVVTRKQNCANRGLSGLNKSGTRGVSWQKKYAGGGHWLARITISGRVIHLGLFPKIEDAIAARRQAERLYWGEFTRK